MAKKVKYETTSNFDIEAGLDIPDFDFGESDSSKKDDRKPATKAARGLFEGIKDEVFSPNLIRSSIRNALPPAYGQTAERVDDVVGTVRDLYTDAVKELKPAVKDLKRTTRKLLPKTEGILPKKIQGMLTEWSKEEKEFGSDYNQQKARDQGLAIELGKIFEAQAEDRDRQQDRDDQKDELREGITQLRHGQSIRQMAGIGDDIHRLVAYQDKILVNYHRKSLELQYRHYFATVDMLELQREVARSQKTQLDDIKKNTGLPEFVKISTSEEFRKGLKNKFAGMLGDGLFGGMRDYLSKFTKNVAERAKMKVGDFVSGVKDAASMADMATDTMDMASSMGDMGPDQHEMGGHMAGSLVGEWGLGKAQKWIGKKIAPHEGIRKLNEKLHYGLNNSENLVGDYLNNPETNWGFFDGLRQFLAESAPSTQPDTALQSHNLMKMDDPAPFTRSASRSLIEIIPGYLARIHREIKVLRTGDVNTPLTTYSYLNNQFTTVKASAKDLKDKLFNRYERDDVHEKLDELIKFVDPKGTLSGDAQKAFKKELLTQSINRKNTDAAHVQRRSHWTGTGEHAPKIAQLFRDKLEIDPDTEKRADTLSAIEAQNAYSTKMKNITSWLNDPRELIQQLRLLGSDDILHELNLLDKKRPDRINLDAFRDMLLEEEHGPLSQAMGKYADGQRLRKVRPLKDRLAARDEASAKPSIVHQQIQPVTATVLPSNADPKQHEALLGRMDQLLEGVRKLDKDEQPNPLIKAIHDATLNIEKSLHDGIKVINLDMEVLSDKFAAKINDGLGKFAQMRDSMFASVSGAASKIKKRFQDLTIGEAFGKVTKGAVSGLDFARKQGQKMLGRGFRLGKQGVALGLKGAGIAGSALKATLEHYYGDLYVGDEKLPRLTQARLEAGYYVDALSGKPIKSFKGITGPVKDIGDTPEGVVVLTAEELKKAYLKGEYPTMLTSIAKGLAGFSIEKLTQARGLIKGGFAIGLNAAVMGFKKFKQMLPPWDVYCRDNMETPLLYAVKMRMGDEYFSKKTGKPIKHPRDIDGVVFDKDKNEVVTEQHIETGLCDVNGIALKNVVGRIAHKVTKLLGKGIAKLKGLASGAMDLLAGIGTYLRDMFGGIFGLRGEYLSTAKKQLDVQTSIYKLLQERLPKPHVVREGSAEQQEAAENAREKQQADDLAKTNAQGADSSDPKANGGKGLASMIKGLFAKKKKGEEDGYGITDQLEVDAAEAAGKKGWGWMRKLGLKGLGKFAVKGLGMAGAAYGGYSAYKNFSQGNYGEGAIDAAGAGLGAATAVGGVGALTGIGGSILAGAGSLIAGAAGLISAPVVLTALGVAAVGYGAYKLYKYLSRTKLETLSTVRYAQYGFNSADDKHLQAVFNLEGALMKNMKVSGDKATFDTSKLDLKELSSAFGVDASNKDQMDKWTRWVNNRFKPVLMASLVNLKNVNSSIDLNDIDKKLSAKEKADYLAKLQGITSSLYDELTSPFTDQRNLTVDANEMTRVFAYAKVQLDNEAKKAATEAAKTGGKLVAAAAAPAAAAAASGLVKTPGKPGDKPAANGATTATRQALTAAGGVAVTSTTMTKLQASANTGVVGAFEQMIGGEGKLGALAAIRMKAYGLFELTQDKVQALRNLELIISKQVKFDKNGASWNEDVEALLNNPMVGAVFGCPGPRSKQGYQWMTWFKFRFLPVYLNFFTSVWKATGKTAFEAFANADYQLKPADALLAGNVMKTTMTTIEGQPAVVWKVQDMPWLGMTANQDVNTVELNIDFLNDQVKKSLLKDQKQAPSAKAKSAPVAAPPAPPADNKPAPPKEDKVPATMKKVAGDNPSLFSTASSNMTTAPSGTGVFSGGDAVKQPGNGTGGDINTVPQAKGSGWDNVKDTLLAAAKMVGVDPQLLAMFAAIESGFNPLAIPRDKNGNRLSNAMGLFQFIPSTWNEMMRKFANKYGIDPMTPPSDARANALLGAEFLKGNAQALKRLLGKDPSTTDLYLAHFLGQGGANQFLHSNPQSAAADAMPKEAQANPGIFYKGGVPSTFAQIYESFTQKLKAVASKFKFGSTEQSKPLTVATSTAPSSIEPVDDAANTKTAPSIDRRMPSQAVQAASQARSTNAPMAATAPAQKRMKLFTPETRDEANLGATAPTSPPVTPSAVTEPAAPLTPPQPVMRQVPNFTGFSPVQTPAETKKQSDVLHQRTNDSIDVLIKNGAAQLQTQMDMAKTLKDILATMHMRSKDQKTAATDTPAEPPAAAPQPFRMATTMPTPAVTNDRQF